MCQGPYLGGEMAWGRGGLLTSAKARKDMAMQIKDSGMASIPAVQASDDLQKRGK